VKAPSGRSLEGVTEPASLPASELALRASDADRERYAEVLRDGYAEGRLDREEYDERLDALYRARTFGELEPLIVDLPRSKSAVPQPVSTAALPSTATRILPAGASRPERQDLRFKCTSSKRTGAWIAPELMTVKAELSELTIDYTEATFAAREVVIDFQVRLSEVNVVVPADVIVRVEAEAHFGEVQGPTEVTTTDVRVLVVRGRVRLGNIKIRRASATAPAAPTAPGVPDSFDPTVAQPIEPVMYSPRTLPPVPKKPLIELVPDATTPESSR